MQQINDNEFAFIHIRPGIEAKEQPVATIAVRLFPESDDLPYRRFAVGFAAQHAKKDPWNAAMGRAVSQGRAERSASRVFVHANAGMSRRDLLIAAVTRVLEAVDSGDINASKRSTRALQDTLARLVEAKYASEAKYFEQAAE